MIEPGLKGLHFFPLLPGKVVLLHEIGFEIEKFDAVIFEPLNELPVALAHAAGGRAALVAARG